MPKTSKSSRVRFEPSALRSLSVVAVLLVLVLSSAGLGLSPISTGASSAHRAAASSGNGSLGLAPSSVPGATTDRGAGSSSASQAFDRRVAETAIALKKAGVPAQEIHLPYVGRPAEMIDGVAIPGYALPSTNVTPYYSSPPAPSGIAYFGENDTSGTIRATTLEASSVVGTLTVNQLSALYLDDDTPDMWGIQLNAVLTNVTLQGTGGYEFWTQNAVDYEHGDMLTFGENTWNYSANSDLYIPGNTSTILRHNPNGSAASGIYVGEGPSIYAPEPFTLTLYLNSSLTAAGEQECWFNYSVLAAGGIHTKGNYDWIVFNSTNPRHPASVPLATFEASGTHLAAFGIIEDFELDFGIGPFGAVTVDVLSANASATLDYCPAAIAVCTPGQFRSVPAAEDFGSETAETSSGLSLTYNGTTATATAGPFILRGLWGYPAAAGSSPGSTPVTNAITVSGSPDAAPAVPYVFVFLNGSTYINPEFEWAPDVPVWHLAQGTYEYEVMLADYAEENGTIVVGTSPTRLAITLPYHPSSGVYTPLWAFGNGQLAGISSSGDGSVTNQYQLFNKPTAGCTECGNAKDGNLSSRFTSWNDNLLPTFVGILLVHTDAYVDIDHPPTFCVFGFSWGSPSDATPGPYFYLQIGLVSVHHVTLANDDEVGGWPAMPELETVAFTVNASENPFPQANVMIWNSSDNLVMSNVFVPAWLAPTYQNYTGVFPAVVCFVCVSPDGLLLYGGTNNTVWGNTFRDPSAPAYAPPQTYAGLAEAESGDLIYNNNFSVDNPTVYLPFDLYNNSCPFAYSGECAPPLPPTHLDTWNVTVQPATDVAATVNGFPLSGNVLGSKCQDQGGNYWQDYGNALNPYGALPFTNGYDYSELLPALPSWEPANQSSIQVGGDFAPLTLNSSTCEGGTTGPSPSGSSSSGLLTLEYTILGIGVAGGIITVIVVAVRSRYKPRSAPWLAAPRGSTTGAEPGSGPAGGALAAPPTELVPMPRPTLRERWGRRPPSLGFLVGAGLLVVYIAAAISALVVFRSSLDQLPSNAAWVNSYNLVGPSVAHPFGVMPGFGTDLFHAIWQATPWDLGIVAGILAIDVFLGFFLGGIAGLDEGGVVDALITFLSDSLGSIPTFLLAVVVFAGLLTVAPQAVGLPVFVLVFGVILWPTMARTVRERARIIAHAPYVEAARASGASFPHILVRHVLPNSLGPVLAQVPLDVAPIFFVLSAFPWYYNCQLPGGPPLPPYSPPLPYLVPILPFFSPLPLSSFPEWGYLLGFGTCEGFTSSGNFGSWWMYLFPLLAIVGLGLALGLFCDGIERWRQFDR